MSSSQIVVVTGINGYIASNVGLQLLRKGYVVRGTSRSAAAKDSLLAEAFNGYESRYEHHVVPDMTAAGAFDKVVRGAHAIIHLASPINMTLKTLDDYLVPAKGGVLSILESTRTAGDQLKAFVLTSSVAAVIDPRTYPSDHMYTNKDWNTSSETAASENFTPFDAYPASKAGAERALWAWRDEHNHSFSISVVSPGVVMGPPVSWPKTPAELNVTLMPVWGIFSGQVQNMPVTICKGSAIDVRDAVALHLWCMEHPEQADGNRYIGSTGKLTPQAIADIIRKHYPDRRIIQGTPGADYLPGTYGYPPGDGGFVADMMYTALQGQHSFISMERMILDTTEAFEKRWPQLLTNTI